MPAFVGYFSNGIQAEVAVDLDFSTPNRFSDISPAPVSQSLFDNPFENRSLVGIVEVNQSKGFRVLGFHQRSFSGGLAFLPRGTGLTPPVGIRLQYKANDPICQWFLRPFCAYEVYCESSSRFLRVSSR